jgi:hypothetical protein
MKRKLRKRGLLLSRETPTNLTASEGLAHTAHYGVGKAGKRENDHDAEAACFDLQNTIFFVRRPNLQIATFAATRI